MQQDTLDTQLIELTNEICSIEGVQFDPESVSLVGLYKDELSLHRARKNWREVLESNFLLEPDYDYQISHLKNTEKLSFLLRCTFLTACGRYAFWRLTNDQAPEAQYIIETAHIPNSELRQPEFLGAPDLKPVEHLTNIEKELPSILYESTLSVSKTTKLIQWLTKKLQFITEK